MRRPRVRPAPALCGSCARTPTALPGPRCPPPRATPACCCWHASLVRPRAGATPSARLGRGLRSPVSVRPSCEGGFQRAPPGRGGEVRPPFSSTCVRWGINRTETCADPSCSAQKVPRRSQAPRVTSTGEKSGPLPARSPARRPASATLSWAEHGPRAGARCCPASSTWGSVGEGWAGEAVGTREPHTHGARTRGQRGARPQPATQVP